MIEILAVYSAFGVKVSDEVYKKIKLKAEEDIPNSLIFGLFTTVVRHQKLPSWPEDIHGCTGYWNSFYEPLTKKQIISHLQTLSFNTTHYDNRKNHFPNPIQHDALSHIDISFMLLPKYIIEAETGFMPEKKEYFNNQFYGLIVDGAEGRATYLPEVFPNVSWDYIKRFVLNKASINNGKFYAYKTIVIRCPIFESLFSPESFLFLEYDIANFYFQFYKDFIPYLYNGSIIIEKDECVRNVSSITDVIKFSKFYDILLKKPIVENLMYYYDLFVKNKERYRQCSAFILLGFYWLGIEKEKQQEIIDYLRENVGKLEKRFEMGEVLMVLGMVGGMSKGELGKERKKMEGMEIGNGIDGVFIINWHVQFVRVLGDVGHGRKLWEKLKKILEGGVDGLETNYWAVIWEALVGLNELLDEDEIKNWMLDMYVRLNERRGKYGLYYFRGMKEARMDISGHILVSKIV